MLTYLLSLFFFIGIIIYFKKKLKTFYNPVSLYVFSQFITVFSIYISEKLNLLRESTLSDSFPILIVLDVSVLFFIIPWRYNIKTIKILSKIEIIEKNISVKMSLINLIILILLIFSYIFLGGLPLLNMIRGNLNVEDYNNMVKNLPLGMLSLILLFSTIQSLYLSSVINNFKKYNYSKYFLIIASVVTFISVIWQGKRQGILMLIFFIIARLFQNDSRIKISYIKITLLTSLFILLFTQIGRVRTNDNNSNYLELISYSMFPAMNFSYTVKNSSLYGTSLYPSNILNDYLPRRFQNNSKSDINTFEPTSPSGYLNKWYKDYGIFGIILGSLSLSLVSKYFYKRKSLNENQMRKYILILWCCVSAGIYNHLITLNFFLIPLISISMFSKFNFKKIQW